MTTLIIQHHTQPAPVSRPVRKVSPLPQARPTSTALAQGQATAKPQWEASSIRTTSNSYGRLPAIEPTRTDKAIRTRIIEPSVPENRGSASRFERWWQVANNVVTSPGGVLVSGLAIIATMGLSPLVIF